MAMPCFRVLLEDQSSRKKLQYFKLLLPATFLFIMFFIAIPSFVNKKNMSLDLTINGGARRTASSVLCKKHCRPPGSETLPEGIVRSQSDLEMHPIQGSDYVKKTAVRKAARNLLAIAAGIKQKKVVHQIVNKFPLADFAVVLFHYDGVVNEWRDLPWSDGALHISAINQTKWWFAKRFLHPDIVSEYEYVFLWDEDIGVQNFHPDRYISIVKEEGLEISQPALDATNSEVHHQITARGRKGRVHRRIYKSKGGGRCYENSTAPPCTGWVEMMAPVFSRAAWRCVWLMIQNDLIHAWGLDMKLGYCAQGDRSKNIGVVDSEYIVHLGIPTLGGLFDNKFTSDAANHGSEAHRDLEPPSSISANRYAIRRRSYTELQIFHERWKKAADADMCWTDPYPDNSDKQ